MKKLILILLMLFIPVACFAEGNEYQTGELENITNTVETTNIVDTDLQNNLIDPNVTVDEVGNKVIGKLYEVADFLKRVAAPVSIIMFVIGALLMVFGAVGKKDGVKQGVIVCLISIIMYAICMYADQIIVALSNWMVA